MIILTARQKCAIFYKLGVLRLSSLLLLGAKSRGRWRAPEEYMRKPLDESLDVYSFGNVLWSFFNDGEVPFPEMKSSKVPDHVSNGARPPLNSHMPLRVRKLIKSNRVFFGPHSSL